ncbi:MAG: YkgJ family cysteine cluster protein [Betaproteobacteria bacterium]|nr:YkgJ family cysteine cluster protein [Betaproteobacteria bacterium]
MTDPCTTCGACCAAYRVDFHRLDLDSAPGGAVPAGLTFSLTANLVRLRGTDDFPPRCVALEGEIGREVRCTIYAQRPGPCRELEPGSDACNRARRKHCLPDL